MNNKLLATALAVFGAIGGTSASAAVVYDWSGTCSSLCTGTASAVLTLADSYTPGTALASADFVSLTFSSSAGTYTVPGSDTFTSFWAGSQLPTATGSTYNFVDFLGGGTYFTTDISGTWDYWSQGSRVSSGTDSNWTLSAVPLPASLPLLAFGFGGLGFMSRRKRKTA